MKFKLDSDEEIILEPKIKIKTRHFIVIMYFCLISCISIIQVCINIGSLEVLPFLIISIVTACMVPQIIPLAIVLTNKRLMYRDLLLIPHNINLNKIVSIELITHLDNLYLNPSRLGLSSLSFKLHDRFFKIKFFVQDGIKLRAEILNYIDTNLKDTRVQ